MDFVYTWKQGSSEEIRYSIRSVLNSFPESNIFIIGDRPRWFTGTVVPTKDYRSKFKNIAEAARIIPTIPGISEDIVYMNDDFFIMNKIDEIPVLHGGSLRNKIDNYIQTKGNNSYARYLTHTFDYLVTVGISNPISYELHRPMPMKKSLMGCLNATDAFPMSVYGNVNNVGGTLSEDVKVYDGVIKTFGSFLSTSDKSFINNRNMFKKMFPNPTRFEA